MALLLFTHRAMALKLTDSTKYYWRYGMCVTMYFVFTLLICLYSVYLLTGSNMMNY